MAQTPLHGLLDEINAAAKNGLPLLAVGMAVALPDICVSLQAADGRSDSTRYKEWCRNNLSSAHFSAVTPDDLYSMRCGVLHNGRFGDLKHTVARVIFVLPNRSNFVVSNGRLKDAYCYNIVEFCSRFTSAVGEWMERNISDATIQANLPRLMQKHHDGFAPYIGGDLSVVA
jgi:hypothetical protein